MMIHFWFFLVVVGLLMLWQLVDMYRADGRETTLRHQLHDALMEGAHWYDVARAKRTQATFDRVTVAGLQRREISGIHCDDGLYDITYTKAEKKEVPNDPSKEEAPDPAPYTCSYASTCTRLGYCIIRNEGGRCPPGVIRAAGDSHHDV